MTELLTRKDIDHIFLDKMLAIAGSNIFLKAKAYVFFGIVRLFGGLSYASDNYDGCGISSLWATSENDPFYHACQFHDNAYSNLKGL